MTIHWPAGTINQRPCWCVHRGCEIKSTELHVLLSNSSSDGRSKKSIKNAEHGFMLLLRGDVRHQKALNGKMCQSTCEHWPQTEESFYWREKEHSRRRHAHVFYNIHEWSKSRTMKRCAQQTRKEEISDINLHKQIIGMVTQMQSNWPWQQNVCQTVCVNRCRWNKCQLQYEWGMLLPSQILEGITCTCEEISKLCEMQ